MAAMETVAHGHQAAAAAAVVSGQGSVAAASTALATVAATTSFVPSQLLVGMLTSGVSVSCANVITSPFDVLKVRLQLERAHLAESIKSPGLIQTGINVVRNEGVLALWSGMGPSLACGLFIGGTRIGLYTPIKNAIAGEGKPVSLTSKILAGSLSGGMAVAIASPMELVKTRLQAAGEIPGAQTTTASVIRAVIQTDGVLGLWKGAPAGTLRLAVLTAAQCATYDEIKQSVMQQTGWCDGARAHFASALIAGLVTTTVSNPLDVVKARMFMGGAKYTSMLQCTRAIIQNDGLMGFMKGWTASYARWAPATVVMFLTAEKLRKYVGLQSL